MPPPRRHGGRARQRRADDDPRRDDRRQLAARLRNRRTNLRPSGLRDREGKHRVEEEARHRHRHDQEADRDQNRSANDVKRLAVQHVGLQVEHGQPDQHRRKDLHEHQPPIGDDQPQPVEQQHEGPHGERQRRELAPAVAEPEDCLLYLLLVTPLDGRYERSDTRPERPERDHPVSYRRRSSFGLRRRRPPKRLELRPQLSILTLEQRDAPPLGHEVSGQPAQRGAHLLR